jgi:hypothetical protein
LNAHLQALSINLPPGLEIARPRYGALGLYPMPTIPLPRQGLTLSLLEVPCPALLAPLELIEPGCVSRYQWLHAFTVGLLVLLELQPALGLQPVLPPNATGIRSHGIKRRREKAQGSENGVQPWATPLRKTGARTFTRPTGGATRRRKRDDPGCKEKSQHIVL